MASKDKTEKPAKYFDDQLDDEEVLFVFRKHPVVMRKGLVLGMLGLLAGTIPTAVRPELGFGWFWGGLLGGLILGLLLFAPAWIAWYFSVYIVTDQRFIQIKQRGLFHRSIVDLALSHVRSLNYEVNGLQATLLGYGTILVQTYMGDLLIEDVHHPAKIYKKMQIILRDIDAVPEADLPEDETS